MYIHCTLYYSCTIRIPVVPTIQVNVVPGTKFSSYLGGQQPVLQELRILPEVAFEVPVPFRCLLNPHFTCSLQLYAPVLVSIASRGTSGIPVL